MAQSRRASAFEAAANIGIGMLVSILVTMFIVAPLTARHGIAWLGSWQGGCATTAIYTIISFLRAYALRRMFDRLGVE